MFDPLLWVLPYFVTHYAGQTNQGNTNDGDGANQPSGSKDAPKQDTDLPLRIHPVYLTRALWGTEVPDQSGASASPPADPRPEEECREAQSYTQDQDADQYNAFTKKEAKYFESEYSPERIIGEGRNGMVFLATKKSSGVQVAYKSIPSTEVDGYTFEYSPPQRCHVHNPLVLPEGQSTEQCTSPRPPNLLLPYETMLQKYLSRPGYENIYVPKVIDHIILEDKFIVVMDYLGGGWVDLYSYMGEKGPLGIVDVRDIVREVVKAMLSLQKQGVVHEDIYAGNTMYNTETGEVKLLDFGMTNILPGWEEGKPFPSKSSNPSSRVSKYKAGDDDMRRMERLGQLIYVLITWRDPYIKKVDYERIIRKTILPDPDSYKSELKENAISLVSDLVSLDPDRTPSIDDILKYSFFMKK
ncbi:hypothetical protein BASA61_009765 [Batrachochytrium salamandrivorans]|nr:hypothetical protein BASA61_009765 [Batrachochytrium salamandrivorans]